MMRVKVLSIEEEGNDIQKGWEGKGDKWEEGGDKIKLFCNDWRGKARKSAQEGEPAQGDAELSKD